MSSDTFDQLKAEYDAFRESSTQLEHELEEELERVEGLMRSTEEKLRQTEENSRRMKTKLMGQLLESQRELAQLREEKHSMVQVIRDKDEAVEQAMMNQRRATAEVGFLRRDLDASMETVAFAQTELEDLQRTSEETTGKLRQELEEANAKLAFTTPGKGGGAISVGSPGRGIDGSGSELLESQRELAQLRKEQRSMMQTVRDKDEAVEQAVMNERMAQAEVEFLRRDLDASMERAAFAQTELEDLQRTSEETSGELRRKLEGANSKLALMTPIRGGGPVSLGSRGRGVSGSGVEVKQARRFFGATADGAPDPDNGLEGVSSSDVDAVYGEQRAAGEVRQDLMGQLRLWAAAPLMDDNDSIPGSTKGRGSISTDTTSICSSRHTPGSGRPNSSRDFLAIHDPLDERPVLLSGNTPSIGTGTEASVVTAKTSAGVAITGGHEGKILSRGRGNIVDVSEDETGSSSDGETEICFCLDAIPDLTRALSLWRPFAWCEPR